MSGPFLDEECQEALDNLNDKIVEFERGTGRGYTVLIIPSKPGEDIYASLDGRSSNLVNIISPEEILKRALSERQKYAEK